MGFVIHWHESAMESHVFLTMEHEQKWSEQLLPHLLKRNSLALSFCPFLFPPGIVTLDTWTVAELPSTWVPERPQESKLPAGWNADLGLLGKRGIHFFALTHMIIRSLLKATYSVVLFTAALKFSLICTVEQLFLLNLTRIEYLFY